MLVTIEGRKPLSIIATLEGERFGRRAVDGNGLSRSKLIRTPPADLGLHVISIPEYCLNIALTVAGSEEGDDVLVAYGGDNGLVSRNWPQSVHPFIRVDGGGSG